MYKDLKPCPFCGSNLITGGSGCRHGKPYSSFGCSDCGASCGIKDSREEAVEAWNTRFEDDLDDIGVNELVRHHHYPDYDEILKDILVGLTLIIGDTDIKGENYDLIKEALLKILNGDIEKLNGEGK